MNANLKWHALALRAGRELNVKRILEKRNIEYYSPVNHILKSEKSQDYHAVPLLPNILFVKVDPTLLPEIKNIKYINNVVYWRNSPATFPDAEIEQMETFLGISFAVKVYKIDRAEPLDAIMTKLTATDRQADRVILPTMGYCLVTQIRPVTNIRLVRKMTGRFSAAVNLAGLLGLK